jgi:hypothetical protein
VIIRFRSFAAYDDEGELDVRLQLSLVILFADFRMRVQHRIHFFKHVTYARFPNRIFTGN